MNREYVSLFSDEVPCLAGRTPLACYSDFMVRAPYTLNLRSTRTTFTCLYKQKENLCRQTDSFTYRNDRKPSCVLMEVLGEKY